MKFENLSTNLHSYSYYHQFTRAFIVHADDDALVVAAALDCGRGEVGCDGSDSGGTPVRGLGEVGGPARGTRETYR